MICQIEHRLKQIINIAHDSPEYGKRLIDRLSRRSQQTAEFPFSGRRVHEYDIDQIREVIDVPCRVNYYINVDRIDVLVVISGSMNSYGSSEKDHEEG